MKSSHWYYKAYDKNLQTVDGVIQAPSIEQAALKLRQYGLQIFEIIMITKVEYVGRRRLLAAIKTQRPNIKVRPGFFCRLLRAISRLIYWR